MSGNQGGWDEGQPPKGKHVGRGAEIAARAVSPRGRRARSGDSTGRVAVRARRSYNDRVTGNEGLGGILNAGAARGPPVTPQVGPGRVPLGPSWPTPGLVPP